MGVSRWAILKKHNRLRKHLGMANREKWIVPGCSGHKIAPTKSNLCLSRHRFCCLDLSASYGGSETQDPSVAPFICTQEHAPLHGCVALQRPLQTPISPAFLCSCRAETVPAKRTAVTIPASNVGLIFLLTVAPPFRSFEPVPVSVLWA